MTTNDAARQLSNVKQSFAWGQLFAGSLIGGLAVWKLAHKLTNTELSEWFAGLSAAYEEVRDFLMTPFEWIDLDLTVDERNILVVILVLLGAAIRAVRRYPDFWPLFLMGPLVLAIAAAVLADIAWEEFGWDFSLPFLPWVGVFLIGLVAMLMFPVFAIFAHAEEIRTPSRFMTMNIIFTIGWGLALLLLNWATS